jgi:group I intron endonuclease
VLLAKAIRKYKVEGFELSILARTNSLDELNRLEEYFIIVTNSESPNGYNLLPGGNCKKHNELTRIKMANSRKGKKNTGRAAKGVPQGPRPKWVGKKISEGKKGWNGLLGKKKIYYPHFKRRQPVIGIHKETKSIISFASLMEAEAATGICYANISGCCKNKRKFAGGYSWSYGKA